MILSSPRRPRGETKSIRTLLLLLLTTQPLAFILALRPSRCSAHRRPQRHGPVPITTKTALHIASFAPWTTATPTASTNHDDLLLDRTVLLYHQAVQQQPAASYAWMVQQLQGLIAYQAATTPTPPLKNTKWSLWNKNGANDNIGSSHLQQQRHQIERQLDAWESLLLPSSSSSTDGKGTRGITAAAMMPPTNYLSTWSNVVDMGRAVELAQQVGLPRNDIEDMVTRYSTVPIVGGGGGGGGGGVRAQRTSATSAMETALWTDTNDYANVMAQPPPTSRRSSGATAATIAAPTAQPGSVAKTSSLTNTNDFMQQMQDTMLTLSEQPNLWTTPLSVATSSAAQRKNKPSKSQKRQETAVSQQKLQQLATSMDQASPSTMAVGAAPATPVTGPMDEVDVALSKAQAALRPKSAKAPNAVIPPTPPPTSMLTDTVMAQTMDHGNTNHLSFVDNVATKASSSNPPVRGAANTAGNDVRAAFPTVRGQVFTNTAAALADTARTVAGVMANMAQATWHAAVALSQETVQAVDEMARPRKYGKAQWYEPVPPSPYYFAQPMHVPSRSRLVGSVVQARLKVDEARRVVQQVQRTTAVVVDTVQRTATPLVQFGMKSVRNAVRELSQPDFVPRMQRSMSHVLQQWQPSPKSSATAPSSSISAPPGSLLPSLTDLWAVNDDDISNDQYAAGSWEALQQEWEFTPPKSAPPLLSSSARPPEPAFAVPSADATDETQNYFVPGSLEQWYASRNYPTVGSAQAPSFHETQSREALCSMTAPRGDDLGGKSDETVPTPRSTLSPATRESLVMQSSNMQSQTSTVATAPRSDGMAAYLEQMECWLSQSTEASVSKGKGSEAGRNTESAAPGDNGRASAVHLSALERAWSTS